MAPRWALIGAAVSLALLATIIVYTAVRAPAQEAGWRLFEGAPGAPLKVVGRTIDGAFQADHTFALRNGSVLVGEYGSTLEANATLRLSWTFSSPPRKLHVEGHDHNGTAFSVTTCTPGESLPFTAPPSWDVSATSHSVGCDVVLRVPHRVDAATLADPPLRWDLVVAPGEGAPGMLRFLAREE